MINFIFAYYQAILDGSENVGRWVRLMYEYVVKGLQTQSFFFDQKKANKRSALLRRSATIARAGTTY